MDNSVKVTSMILGVILVISIMGLIVFVQMSPPSQTLSTNGVATIKVVPDLMVLNLNVVSRADNLGQANQENSEKVSGLIDSLKKIGIEENKITTTSLSVNEEYDWSSSSGRKFLGYIATQNIRVEIPTNKSELMSKAIDASVSSNAIVSYINFELSKDLENSYKAQAIELATLDAKKKAQAMVQGLGQKLGKVVSISDSEIYYSPYSLYRNYYATDSVEVAGSQAKLAIESSVTPSEQEIYGSVRIIYSVK